MPLNSYIIGTKTPGSDVLVFDISKHPSNPGMTMDYNLVNVSDFESAAETEGSYERRVGVT